MAEINDGGCAFPVPEVRDMDGCGLVQGSPGMSLRDWFAGQALAGMQIGDERDFDAEGAAEYAYRCADAMIAARSLST